MLTINGKQPKDVTAEAWRKLSGFEPFHDGTVDITGTIERIAIVYGVTPEEVAAHISVSDVLPCYLDCVKLVNELVFSKLNKLSGGKKN